MEQTIKQLEEMLKVRKEQKEIIECAGGTCVNCNPDIQALQNAIDGLKKIEQLDKENKKLKGKYNIQPVLVNNSMFFIDNELYENLLVDINKNYIPKSVIRDKIEELYNKQDKEDEILSDKGFDLGMRNYLTTKEVTIKVLKEILGDE